MLNGREKSGAAMVAMKPANKAGRPGAEQGEPRACPPRRRQAGDLRLLGLYVDLQHVAQGHLPDQAEGPCRPPADEAEGDQGETAPTHAPVDRPTGQMAG